jgi:hypothetical protein
MAQRRARKKARKKKKPAAAVALKHEGRPQPREGRRGGARRSCGCLQVHFGLLDSYPEFRANQARIEQFTRFYVQAGDFVARRGVTTIPVVVHVVYRTDEENVSDRQLRSQIAVLNRDFRAANPDVAKVPAPFRDGVADARIEFALAGEDPDGKRSSGILRVKTTRRAFRHFEDDVKSSATGGSEPWDAERYLNIWVCTLAGGLLGYAQFPGGPPQTDGVVIRNTAFGTSGTTTAPFNRGRTTVHEVGHYLNLPHIWGENRIPSCGDSDLVDDTPNQFDKNFGKPDFPHVSCNNGPHGDMFMNYMDYVDDDAMFMFTHGQVMRMQATLAGPRSGLGA